MRLRGLERGSDRGGLTLLLDQPRDLCAGRGKLVADRLGRRLAAGEQLLQLGDAAGGLGGGLDLRARLFAQRRDLRVQRIQLLRIALQAPDLCTHLLEGLAQLALALRRLCALLLRRHELRLQRRQQLLGIGCGGHGSQLCAEPVDLPLELALALLATALERLGASLQLARTLCRLLLVGSGDRQLGAHRREQLIGVRTRSRRQLGAQALDLRLQLALELGATALQLGGARGGPPRFRLRCLELRAQGRELLGPGCAGRGLRAEPLDLPLELALTLLALGLEHVDARRELARPGRRLVARILCGHQRVAQRRKLLLGAGRVARSGKLGTEARDLLLQLALAQVGELAVDDVLEPGAQLEQLDLVDRDLALELAQLLGIGLRHAGLAGPVRAAAAGGNALQLALAVGERRLQALDLDVELVHELRILEHGLGDLAAIPLGVDIALELGDATFLLFQGSAELHRVGGLLGQPVTAVLVLAHGDDALALLQYLQPLFELRLHFLQDALALLLDALLDRVFLHASERPAQAAARSGLRSLIEAVLETAVMGVVCDGASLSRGYLSTDACGA